MKKYLKLFKESFAAYQVYKFLTDAEESRCISDEGLKILNERDKKSEKVRYNAFN